MEEYTKVTRWSSEEELKAELESLQQKQAAMKAELSQRRKNLVELQQKKQRVLKAQIRRAQARITNAERKRRTHRLVLIGTYIEHTTQDDQGKRDQLMTGLDAFLERNHDRAVFDLKPLPKPPAPSSDTPVALDDDLKPDSQKALVEGWKPRQLGQGQWGAAMLGGEQVAALPESDHLPGTPIRVTDRRGKAWITTLKAVVSRSDSEIVVRTTTGPPRPA